MKIRNNTRNIDNIDKPFWGRIIFGSLLIGALGLCFVGLSNMKKVQAQEEELLHMSFFEDGYALGMEDVRTEAIEYGVGAFKIVDEYTGEAEFGWVTNSIEVSTE